MPGFCGVFSFRHGSHPLRADINRMLSAFCPAEDIPGTCVDGALALGAFTRPPLPEPARLSQPLVTEDLIIAGHFRLDDRPGLLQALGLPASTLHADDSLLFVEAWRKWGAACADHVLGDWVCAVWDRRQCRLWIGKDVSGNTGLYFWKNDSKLVFATNLNMLLAYPDVPKRPNADMIARQLVTLHDTSRKTATVYDGIEILPGGHDLSCDQQGPRLRAWWHPEQLDEFRMTENECLEEFRTLYQRAVLDRLPAHEGRTGLMLSAGLDSGSVAAWAAPALAARNQRLTAYASVPAYAPDGASRQRLGNEGHLAAKTAEHIGHIDLLTLPSRHEGILRSMERSLARHGRPLHAAVNQYWIDDILTEARAAGIQVMLTGQGGNSTVSWAGTGNLWLELAAGRLTGLRSLIGRDAWQNVRVRLLKPLLMPVLASLSSRNSHWQQHSAISQALVRETQLDKRHRAIRQTEATAVKQMGDRRTQASYRLSRITSSLGSTWMDLATSYGVDVCDPTLDRRLVEFCWRVPDAVFWADGLRRGLIRKGMADSLPSCVMQHQRKGLQAADIGHRILAEADAFQAALDDLAQHPLASAWLDIARMRSILPTLRTAVTPETSQQALTTLVRGISMGLFLATF